MLAIGAGLDALRDAGIPLVMTYKTTTTGTKLPERWMLPVSMRDDTGVIFASAFPGADSLAEEIKRFDEDNAKRARLDELRQLRAKAEPGTMAEELDRRIHEVESDLEANGYRFDRRFLYRVLSFAHAQFAEYIGARGPNTQINAACASTTQAVAIAEDWIRQGRCARVVIISADDVTTDNLVGWVGSGFLAVGAAATDDAVEDAAVPFDRRRHGMIIGMGAAALVIESAESVASRGMQPIVEVLGAVTANSAFHGSRLDPSHIKQVMERLVSGAERTWGLRRETLASEMVFVSHETYTPARGGQRSGRDRRAPPCIRRTCRRHRHHEHQGLHRPCHGHRHRGCSRRQVAGDRGRSSSAQPPGGRPGPRKPQPLRRRRLFEPIRPPAGCRLRFSDLDDSPQGSSVAARPAS